MSEAAALAPGTVLADRYRILGVIGSGMSGTVYRSKRIGSPRQLALKLMHAEHRDRQRERLLFAREAELVMKLQHPHIVPLLDYGHTDDGTPFLVFALLRGRSLAAKLQADGALSWETTGRFSIQVLRALERAHALGIAHRDIKPGNIFLSTGVMGEVAQVLDFGLAKLVGEPDEADAMSEGTIMGTPRYMAPEQVRGGRIGHEVDIYSFGLVMAEMLTGVPLVDGSELDMYVAQGSDRPHVLPEAVQLSPFAPVIERAVHKEVAVRYRLASQMLADTRAAVERIEMDWEDDDDPEADLDVTRVVDGEAAEQLLAGVRAEQLRAALNLAADQAAMKQAAADKTAAKSTTEAAAEADAGPEPLPRGASGDSDHPGDEPASDRPTPETIMPPAPPPAEQTAGPSLAELPPPARDSQGSVGPPLSPEGGSDHPADEPAPDRLTPETVMTPAPLPSPPADGPVPAAAGPAAPPAATPEDTRASDYPPEEEEPSRVVLGALMVLMALVGVSLAAALHVLGVM